MLPVCCLHTSWDPLTVQLLIYCWLVMWPARHAGIPPAPTPMNRILDTHFWKYYLAPTSLQVVMVLPDDRHRKLQKRHCYGLFTLHWTGTTGWYTEWDWYNRIQWALFSAPISDQWEHICIIDYNPLILVPFVVPVQVLCSVNIPLGGFKHQWSRQQVNG